MSLSNEHKGEIERGERFAFGQNWARFLRVLNADRIAAAEKSLVDMLGVSRLDGKSFLDIGSGSGLFSLAARGLGATVRSFDYDPQSYACTHELRRRYFPGDAAWIVELGSVLDRGYLDRLGTYDVVYSWGVLHHTGQMWAALDNIKPLVNVGGQLFIAIYNDLGAVTNRWETIKKRYNALPTPVNTAYLLWLLAKQQRKDAFEAWRTGKLDTWLRSWTDYNVRGMSRWRDLVDWYGGYPYERASIEAIADVYGPDGFRLTRIVDRSLGYGCNEFVFERVAPKGTFIDSPIPGGLSFARQYGRRVLGPFERREAQWWGRPASLPHVPRGTDLILFRDGKLVSAIKAEPDGSVPVAPATDAESAVASAKFYVAAAECRAPTHGFEREAGYAWKWVARDLEGLGDETRATPRGSPVYVFQGDTQLPWPHAFHDDLRNIGLGRFSHWGTSLIFSTLDNADPNATKDKFRMLIAADGLQRAAGI